MIEVIKRQIDGWLDKASKKLGEAKEHLDSPSYDSEVIQAAQECVELSVKSIFALLGIDYPSVHGIAPDQKVFVDVARQIREKKLMEKLEVQGLAYTIRLPRLLFLLHFWAQFYTVAKYGFQRENLASARDLFGDEEAKLAVHHAEECLRAAQQLRYLGGDRLAALLPTE